MTVKKYSKELKTRRRFKGQNKPEPRAGRGSSACGGGRRGPGAGRRGSAGVGGHRTGGGNPRQPDGVGGRRQRPDDDSRALPPIYTRYHL